MHKARAFFLSFEKKPTQALMVPSGLRLD
ncbi:hypothetical protein OCEANICA350_10235 [Oceanicaulis sp. 350]|nr:hypothetical protein OCEANICA350_10235 [Oceanicaulis sp. 350]